MPIRAIRPPLPSGNSDSRELRLGSALGGDNAEFVVAVAKDHELEIVAGLQGAALRTSSAGTARVAMPPITPTRIAIASASGEIRTRMSPGAIAGRSPGVANPARRAQRLAVCSLEFERLCDRRCNGERLARPVARHRRRAAARRRWQRPAGPAHCARSGSRWLGRRREPGPAGGLSSAELACRMPISPSHGEANPDRQNCSGQDQQQLRRGGQPGEPLGEVMVALASGSTPEGHRRQLSLPMRSRKSSGTDSRSVSS